MRIFSRIEHAFKLKLNRKYERRNRINKFLMKHKAGEESDTTKQIQLNKINENKASNHESTMKFKKTKLEMMTDLGDYRNSKVAKKNGTRDCEEVCYSDEF